MRRKLEKTKFLTMRLNKSFQVRFLARGMKKMNNRRSHNQHGGSDRLEALYDFQVDLVYRLLSRERNNSSAHY